MKLAIIGSTGLIGNTVIRVLEERKFPVTHITFFSSKRSKGTPISFQNKIYYTQEFLDNTPLEFDIVFLIAGGELSKKIKIENKNSKTVFIDLSSAFRLDPKIPLVIPEINIEKVNLDTTFISSPNCTTTFMNLVLAPLHKEFHLKKIIVSTYQAASGGGQELLNTLLSDTKAALSSECKENSYAFNAFPMETLENGYATEEMKMIHETQKLLEDTSVAVSPTCIRVPTKYSHCLSVTAFFDNNTSKNAALEVLSKSTGIAYQEESKLTPRHCSGKDKVFYGRVRDDLFTKNCLHFWIAGDQLRKGGALNAVQIAEHVAKLQSINLSKNQVQTGV